MQLQATKRELTTKNAGKKSLHTNSLPAVLYNYEENESVALVRLEFEKLFPKLKPNSIITLKLPEGEKKVVVKDYDVSLKTQQVLHVDFYVLGDREINIHLPLDFKGLPVGISQGGIIRRFSERVLCHCKPSAIPSAVEVDISPLKIDDCLYLKDLPKLPGVDYLESPSKAIVAVIITSKAAATKAAQTDETKKTGKEASAEKK